MINRWVVVALLFSFIIGAGMVWNSNSADFTANAPLQRVHNWQFRSVDTVKFSRDLASQMINNPDFDETIDRQVSDIASLGSTHVAISTPYDEEFVPFLKRWVKSARNHNLKVWFRGNFSGWENWFNYPNIDREEHKKLVEEFIVNNPDLFEDGDIFTSCPECENGAPGDPRQTGDVKGFRDFLVDEYKISEKSFSKIGKKVQPGFYSMNYDVAKIVMDEDTANKLGNLVVIDHYIEDPKKLAEDAKLIADKSRSLVVLGEIGAPIPDIHGSMTEKEQADWIEQALSEVKNVDEVIGINYWTNVGGSTGLWYDNGSPKEVIKTLERFYKETKLISVR